MASAVLINKRKKCCTYSNIYEQYILDIFTGIAIIESAMLSTWTSNVFLYNVKY